MKISVYFLVLSAVLIMGFSMSFSQEYPLELLGTASFSDIEGICVDGDYLYCAFRLGLGIYDLEVPDEPELISTLYIEGEGKRVAVEGDYLYFAAGTGGLAIVDVSRHRNPVLVSTWETSDIINGVVIKDCYAYLSAQAMGLYVINISDPSSPFMEISHYLSGGAWDLTMHEDYLYVARGLAGMQIISVADRTHPATMGSFTTTSVVHQVTVMDHYAFLAADASGLIALDVYDPMDPTELDRYLSPTFTMFSVASRDNYVYAGCDNQGVLVFDGSHPSSLERVDWFTISGIGIRELSITDGDYMYASVTDGVIALNIADPTSIYRDGWHYPTHDFRRVLIKDDYAFVVARSDGIQVVYVGDPYDPVEIANFRVTAIFRDVAISGDYMFIASNNGMQIVNITDITNPDYDTSYTATSYCTDIAIIDEIAYLTYNDVGIKRINIADPIHPMPMGEYSSPAPTALYVDEDCVYFTDDEDGLVILHRNYMSLLGQYPMTWTTLDICKLDYYLFVAGDDDGVYIFDIADPTEPELIGQYETDDDAKGVCVEPGWLYVAEKDEGIEVLNIEDDPANPVSYGFYPAPERTYGLQVIDGIVYVANEVGFMIFDNPLSAIPENSITKPGSYHILKAYPNPFNSSVTISVNMQNPPSGLYNEPIKLEICDVRGRVVYSLPLQASQLLLNNAINWDGKDDAGNNLSSGLYFCRLKMGEYSETTDLLLIK
ncbi:T9SS type A sorting domain-containing protein [bacterium]|nr:T9SS type A sorting domain-containing protein [bacterium]